MYNGNPKLFNKICTTCGVEFVGGTTAKFCPDCRAERIRNRDNKRHATGPARKLGSIDLCERCNKKYEVISGNQKFCPDCSKIEERRHKAEIFAKLYADPSKRAAMLANSIRWAKAHPKCVAHISHIYWIKKGKKKRMMKMAKQGGYRPNSGRKKELPDNAKPYSFKLTPDEQVQVRDFINQLRSDNMTRYLVSFTNSQGAWLETVEVESKSANVDYIKNLAKKQSKYQIDRDCSITVFDTTTEEYI